ncbi:FKBP-type peptidyl-prolyl cis-trans isomerase [Bizionia echini]|uniref:peptidylprolyl isomerase n=1 Tax=Bizionia echini TaxID=649333 RepID=A0A1I5CE88_9FLAO|nr:FKBP-type peptidyl-prolyl cis-trans isomerase [Bizionia echini]SFN85329.1 FKBP-type peptidyl-prolyl cis-trans isomerase [Bizionia echini]
MKLRKILLLLIVVSTVFTACEKDDGVGDVVPLRDAAEVYEEDLIDIETYLETHFYNYEEFQENSPYSLENDEFRIVFDTIAGDNADKTPLKDMVNLKIVPFDGIDYKLYYLNVREGLGKEIHFTDQATLIYEGSSTIDNYVFDSAVNESQFNLLTVGSSSGVVPGFQQALVEFKTSDSFTVDDDGPTSYHNHGIGAVFIPSRLGYFNSTLEGVPNYTPIIFKFNLYKRAILDHDIDGIPSWMEDIDGNGDVYDDDTNGNFTPDFLDNDDDGDGYFTKDELEYSQYTIIVGDPEPIFADNEFESSRQENNGVITIKTVIITDRDDDGVPDYLDIDTIPES